MQTFFFILTFWKIKASHNFWSADQVVHKKTSIQGAFMDTLINIGGDIV